MHDIYVYPDPLIIGSSAISLRRLRMTYTYIYDTKQEGIGRENKDTGVLNIVSVV